MLNGLSAAVSVMRACTRVRAYTRALTQQSSEELHIPIGNLDRETKEGF
jgi:hypothetical protein